MATTTTKTNKPILPRGVDNRPVDSYNRAELYSGKALDFDGVNDYVDLDGFTMAGNVATIVFYGKFTNDGRILDLNPNRFIIENTASGLRVYNNTSYTIYGTTDRDKVGFYAIVSDGTTQRAYYNGHQLGSDATITALDWDSVTNMKLGAYFGGGSVFLDGQLSGFKIFNTALTAAQVADLYNNPEKVVPTGVADSALKLWLPMQEGAGTTAYDGSGNRNHGTISGATYTHGIGAPVAQTAVIDWNKGTNLAQYSEEFDDSYWGLVDTQTPTPNATTAPDGQTTAEKIVPSTNNAIHYIWNTSIDLTGQNTISIFAKYNGYNIGIRPQGIGSGQAFANFDLQNGTILGSGGTSYEDSSITSFSDGWYRISMTMDKASTYGINYYAVNGTTATELPTFTADGTSGYYIWGAQVNAGATLTPYVRTGAAAQTSPVLLPQGLTTGRDITGVNLFENVRKQGALNLDGNSWAEVHDNASLDFGTGSFTLEAWAKASYKAQGSVLNTIMVLGGNSATGTAALNITNSLVPAFYYHTTSRPAQSGSQNEGDWFHIVGVYDETNITIYINGQQDGQSAKIAIDLTNTLVKYIGRDSTTVRYYQNCIAQPRIYNRALTASEVLQNFNATKTLYI